MHVAPPDFCHFRFEVPGLLELLQVLVALVPAAGAEVDVLGLVGVDGVVVAGQPGHLVRNILIRREAMV